MKNIYVGNMSFQTDEERLRSTFSQFGAVDAVNIVRDRDSGQPRGFAFVEMPNDSEAEAAMTQLNGSTLDGRQLTVNEARPKAERGNFAGGGRGGFGGNRGGGGRPGGGGGRGGNRGGGRDRGPRW
ncbi:MAG TPA: RNA-binding protein [Terriglobales bacterium]|nr:RNA-binding protein [Terriglobales bacterium]